MQLRLLFSILIGVGTGAGVLLESLGDPFRQPFSIELAAQQLHPFEELLESDMEDAERESKQVGMPALIMNRHHYQRPNYHTGNTIYFHLLTGSRAGTVKAVGDIVAWVFRQLSRTVVLVKRIGSWPWRRKRSQSN